MTRNLGYPFNHVPAVKLGEKIHRVLLDMRNETRTGLAVTWVHWWNNMDKTCSFMTNSNLFRYQARYILAGICQHGLTSGGSALKLDFDASARRRSQSDPAIPHLSKSPAKLNSTCLRGRSNFKGLCPSASITLPKEVRSTNFQVILPRNSIICRLYTTLPGAILKLCFQP